MTQINIFNTAQKLKFSIKDFFSKCENTQFPLDLVTFTEEILNGKLHFCEAQGIRYTNQLKLPNI